MFPLNAVAFFLLTATIAGLTIIWWIRHSRRGLDWVLIAVPIAFLTGFLSSNIFQVPDYQAGCDGYCLGWWGYPFATHMSTGIGQPRFNPAGFIANAFIHYTVLLLYSGFVLWLSERYRWSERNLRWRLAFVFVIVVLPMAMSPIFLPTRGPQLSGQEQRLAVNAERAWRWQLQFRRFNDRRLVLEDVRPHPDGERHRACFRIHTWFFLPYDRVYIDLEPTGVRATSGGVISLDSSCWVQP